MSGLQNSPAWGAQLMVSQGVLVERLVKVKEGFPALKLYVNPARDPSAPLSFHDNSWRGLLLSGYGARWPTARAGLPLTLPPCRVAVWA